METQVWTKTEEKFANLLTLRGHEVHELRVSGNVLTMKRNLKGVQEALDAGRPPAEAGAKVVETLDARTIAKAELSPGNAALTLHGPGEKPTKVYFSPGDKTADAILGAILARSGQTFHETQEEVGVVEALAVPGTVGVLGGLFCFFLYDAATKLAAGEELVARGRKKGLQTMINDIAGLVGPSGALAIAGAFLLLIGLWGFRQLTKRPMRTVLKPAVA